MSERGMRTSWWAPVARTTSSAFFAADQSVVRLAEWVTIRIGS